MVEFCYEPVPDRGALGEGSVGRLAILDVNGETWSKFLEIQHCSFDLAKAKGDVRFLGLHI